MVRVLIFRIRIEVATSAFNDEPCSYSFELLVKDSFSLNLWSPESHAMSCIAQSFDNSPAGHLVHLFGSLLLLSLHEYWCWFAYWVSLGNGIQIHVDKRVMEWFWGLKESDGTVRRQKKSRIAVILTTASSSISLQDGHNKLIVSIWKSLTIQI